MTVPTGVSVYLELNSVPLDTYAWRVLSYGDMFSAPPVRGGEGRVFPTAAGRRATRGFIDASVKSLSLHVFGHKAQDGSAIANPLEGLLTHEAYLRANLGLGKTTGDGTVAATWHRGTLGNLTGPATVLAITDWENIGGREATFRLDFTIPAGALT